ncbi:hypothetical protein WJX73_000332 [Symbiochloris irregularis]|uniref:Corrinoid adenosyltransferase MMAB n=1 Tax=Symbiochloris irregularis TaxID=706552 RepID=A0AAW1PF84_9CHLO
MRIYTKTGDDGTSSLYTGERRPKSDVTFQALGDVDELNSALGVARAAFALEKAEQSSFQEHQEQLESIQSRLLDAGSAIATPQDSASEAQLSRAAFDTSSASELEEWLDHWQEQLPPLTNFILPSGGSAACALHMARTICRRAERSVMPLASSGATDKAVGVYLNRLSDYLFVLARAVAQQSGEREVIYKKKS